MNFCMNIFQLTIKTNACKNSLLSKPKSQISKSVRFEVKNEREIISMLKISGVEAVLAPSWRRTLINDDLSPT